MNAPNKIAHLLIIIVFAASLLSGCGESSDTSSPPIENTEQNTVTPDTGEPSDTEITTADSRIASIKSYLIEESHQADVMITALPRELNEKAAALTEQMKENLELHSEWYMKTLGELKSGEPFPYDKRLGVSEDDYQFILNLNDHMSLIKESDTTVEIKYNRSSIEILNSASPILKKMNLALDANILTTELGELTYSNEISASDEQQVTGRWNGHTWTLQEEMAQSYSISIGQLEESKKTIIYIKLLDVGQPAREEVLVF
ncbi:hypothetical protein PAECIP111893_01205 [Paenibacillus plantiphilus]|uniref:Lipoprotein n=1 Tax=Paenibacillus plantiphilus TaxID=2905650 RepID=A0ABN8G693_9BACL|nr:hypothetical protein [Paenibacillus plantiphilus]CAH1199004.1 hypothetical protein PAECIP111893_01205 [Paenibacillus plantiphilus]